MEIFHNVKMNKAGSVEVSRPSSTSLCYRISYDALKSEKHGLEIKNRFIVYILHGRNDEGKDFLYIGKSKNGIAYRPKAHDDKDVTWDVCYVLTQFEERTILNDGTVQYLEDILTDKARATNRYNVLTQQTTKGTANSMDEVNCRYFLDDVLDMLHVLGLDLRTTKPVQADVLEEPKSVQGEPIVDTNVNYWMYSAGKLSEHFDEFYGKGIIALGWRESGDLTQYSSKEEIKESLQRALDPTLSFTNSSLALWQFANVMKPGDIVFVKQGTHTIIGYGVVKSDYSYDTMIHYSHTRKIEWTKISPVHTDRNLGQKTLTKITEYKEYVSEMCELLKSSKDVSPDGLYTISTRVKAWDNKEVKGTMRIQKGKYIVLKGSVCCPIRSNHWRAQKGLDKARADCRIEDDILQEDVEFTSPSYAAAFLTWKPENGWDMWKDEEGRPLSRYRK